MLVDFPRAFTGCFYYKLKLCQILEDCTPHTLLQAWKTSSLFFRILTTHPSIWRAARCLLNIPAPPATNDDYFFGHWTELRYAVFLFGLDICGVILA